MRGSKLTGPLEPLGSGGFDEGTTEACKIADQLAIDFSQGEDRSSMLGDEVESEQDGSAPREEFDTEIAPPTGPHITDVREVLLNEPQPLLYQGEGAKKSRPALDRYLKPGGHVYFSSYSSIRDLVVKPYGQKTEESIIAIRDRLYHRFLEGRSFPDMLGTMYDILCIISKICSISTVGSERRNRQGEDLIFALAESFITYHDPSPEDEKYFFTYCEYLKKIHARDEDSFTTNLFSVMGHPIVSYVSSRQCIEQQKLLMTERLAEILKKEQGALKEMADTFVQELRTQRRQGVRSSFYQDDIFHAASQVFVMMNPFEFSNQYGGVLAVLFLAERDDVAQKGVSVTGIEQIKSHDVSMIREATSFDGSLEWCIGLDGEFYVTPLRNVHRISVRQLYARAGQEPLYEIFRLSVVARIHDMMVPGARASHFPHHAALNRAIQDLAAGNSDGEILNIVKDFLIPRQQYMRNREQQRRDERQEQNRARQILGERRIAGTIYELPEGCWRTKYADKNFFDYEKYEMSEIDPSRGWTYRKPHKRAVTRPVRVVPEQKSDADEA